MKSEDDRQKHSAKISDEQLMLARVIHELMGPLAAARNMAHYLKRRFRNEAELNLRLADLELYLEIAIRSVRNLDFIGHKQPSVFSTTPTHLKDVLDTILAHTREVLRANAPRTNPIIEIRGLRKCPPLRVQRDELGQVFFNLLLNAIKYRRRDEPVFRVVVSCEYSHESREGYAISISDWGIGIPEGWNELIFEEGVRAPNALQVAPGGVGLGLYVARDIAGKLGGDVVLSRMSAPTVFTVFLPSSVAWEP